MEDLEVRERLAKIDQLSADAALKRQEFDLGYHLMSAVTAAAGLMAAGAAIGVLLAKL
jgi:hypothetical protein